MNLTQIATSILNLTDDELKTLNSEVVALLNHRLKMKQFQAAQAFNVGDKVFFINSRTNTKVEGKIEKINIKTIQIRTEVGVWKVSPSLVQAA